MNGEITISLTDSQRGQLDGLLDQHAARDYEGALLAQVSNTGQELTVRYIEPPDRQRLRAFLARCSQRVRDFKARQVGQNLEKAA